MFSNENIVKNNLCKLFFLLNVVLEKNDDRYQTFAFILID